MYKFVILAATLAAANAGYLGGYAAAPALATTYATAAPAVVSHGYAAPAALTSQSSNILRSYGNLGQVSTYTKTIDTPYSSVRKSDVRVSNPGLATAYAAPALAHTAYAAPAIAAPAYAAPAYAAPAVAHGYAAPAVAHGYAAAPALAAPGLAARAGLLGVAYSAAPAVAHISFDGLGTHYAW